MLNEVKSGGKKEDYSRGHDGEYILFQHPATSPLTTTESGQIGTLLLRWLTQLQSPQREMR